jgi:hypothetical protein
MINNKIDDKEYWEGVLHTCEYFRDELGIEDAMETSLAMEARAELSIAGVFTNT